MGYTMRTERYRFTRWQRSKDPNDIIAYELYDLIKDSDCFVNIAGYPQNKKLLTQLNLRMQKEGIGNAKIVLPKNLNPQQD